MFPHVFFSPTFPGTSISGGPISGGKPLTFFGTKGWQNVNEKKQHFCLMSSLLSLRLCLFVCLNVATCHPFSGIIMIVIDMLQLCFIWIASAIFPHM